MRNLLAALGLSAAAALAVAAPNAPAESPFGAQALPFGPGERALYQVRLGGVSVGEGAMEVVGTERVQGHVTYRARLRVQGGLPFARVRDIFETWFDPDDLLSRRFHQDQQEVRYKRRRTFEFYPEQRSYVRLDNGERGTLPTDRPLDEVAFLYFVRTLPLEVGRTYTFDRYFDADGNPVVLQVLRRETVRVPAGTFQTIVVRPIIRTRGLFSEGGQAEVFFSDDERRILVQMRSRVPVIGSLSLHLRSYQPPAP